VIGAVNAFLYYFNRKYIYGGKNKDQSITEEELDAESYEVL
jgi:hypothetical protein